MNAASMPTSVDTDLKLNEQTLRARVHHTADLDIKKFALSASDTPAFVAYMKGAVDEQKLYNYLQPLLLNSFPTAHPRGDATFGQIKQSSEWEVIQSSLFEGMSCVFIQGESQVILLDTTSWPVSPVTEPQSEFTLKGARIGFNESGASSLAMIRSYLPTSDLRIRKMTVGTATKTQVYLLSMKNIADEEDIEVLADRIARTDTDAILNTGELVEYIEDRRFTLFPQFVLTERPDWVATNLLNGKVALVVDRSPHVLLGPVSFLSFFHSVDDHNMRWPVATFFRLLRFAGLLIAVLLPSFYIAAISFHYEIIPIDLVYSIGISLEQVPFPPIIEALFMEITLEMLREAGLRLPSKIGQTIGIVGGIVIGQAAVQANFVSNIMIIVVALTAIASFIQPNQDMGSALRLLRFPFMLAAYFMGLIGIVIGIMIVVIHVLSLQSLNKSYTAPLFPVRLGKWKSAILRLPLTTLKRSSK
ncbi:hypothetical protein SY83_05910 [Paenibacillus swuensis]|uniref:Uncharacterized protein n=1 Tax=Paenibacillus swuensis TaxID=1178515 RepID=A0A172TGJ3_9BACL|nr:spore germination protein [Paenibacillus swuensis]ANE45903.1 hypothetical protein SY83_05910 [Paenibacillus swuensis]